MKANFTLFRSLLAKLALIHQSRSDISCVIALLREVSAKTYVDKAARYIKKANKILDYLHLNHDLVLKFPKLEKETIFPEVYIDAVYAVNKDFSSQLGYIIY